MKDKKLGYIFILSVIAAVILLLAFSSIIPIFTPYRYYIIILILILIIIEIILSYRFFGKKRATSQVTE